MIPYIGSVLPRCAPVTSQPCRDHRRYIVFSHISIFVFTFMAFVKGRRQKDSTGCTIACTVIDWLRQEIKV